MRVLIAGGEDYADVGRFNAFMDALLLSRFELPVTVVCRRGAGVPNLAFLWALENRLDIRACADEAMPSGRTVDQHMVETQTPDLVVAFPGADEVLACAAAAGVEIIRAA